MRSLTSAVRKNDVSEAFEFLNPIFSRLRRALRCISEGKNALESQKFRACGGLSGVFLKVKRLRITKIPRLRLAQREQLAHIIEIYSGFSTHTKCRVKKVSGLMLTIATNTSQTYLYPQRSYCKCGKYYRILVHTLKTSKTGVFNVIKGVNSPPQARKKWGFA